MEKAVKENKPRRKAAIVAELVLLAALLAGAVWLLRWGYYQYMRAAYPLEYSQIVLPYAEEYGIEPSLVYAVIRTESGFDPEAVSRADAMGLMQLTEATLDWAVSKSSDKEEVTKEDLFTPAVNIRYGVYVLKLLGEQFEVRETQLAAYNAGMGHVREWLADPACSSDGKTLTDIPFPETKAYVEKVLSAQAMYRELYDLA